MKPDDLLLYACGLVLWSTLICSIFEITIK